MSSKETQPGLHQIWLDGPTLPGLLPVNVFLLIGSNSTALIDSGFDREDQITAILEDIKNAGVNSLDFIILTQRHHDHIGGAIAVKRVLGGEIICRSVEKELIETESKGLKVDRVVEDSQTLDLGNLTLEFVHTPGHTLGSLSVFVPEQGAFFPGDNILGRGTTAILSCQGDMGIYLESLRRIMEYSVTVLYSAHGPVIDQPHEKLEGLIHRRLERECEILALLGDEERTVDQLFPLLYSTLQPHLHDTAKLQIRSHFAKLEREKGVVALGDSYQLCLSPSSNT